MPTTATRTTKAVFMMLESSCCLDATASSGCRSWRPTVLIKDFGAPTARGRRPVSEAVHSNWRGGSPKPAEAVNHATSDDFAFCSLLEWCGAICKVEGRQHEKKHAGRRTGQANPSQSSQRR
uniref:Secreted protein n=1 Tax=Panagrellus redivivus TaxID=6233 RepID=A0A7E4WCN8_PANRE